MTFLTRSMQNYQIIPVLLARQVNAEEVDRLSEWKERRYRELVADRLVLSAGAGELLNDLKRNGFLLAIGSSAPRANLNLILTRLGLQSVFDACVTKEDVTRGKPAPDTFLKAAEKLSVPPYGCVVVEDAVQGVEAGKTAGMRVVAVTATRNRADLANADIVVDSLIELTAKDFTELLAGCRD